MRKYGCSLSEIFLKEFGIPYEITAIMRRYCPARRYHDDGSLYQEAEFRGKYMHGILRTWLPKKRCT